MAEDTAARGPDHGDEPDDDALLADVAGDTGMSVDDLGAVLGALLAEPEDDPALDVDAIWRRVAELTWGDDA